MAGTAPPSYSSSPLLLLVLVLAGASASDGASEIVRRALARRCADNYTTTCLKLDAVALVDGMWARDSLQIVPSVAVVRTGARPVPAPLPEDVVNDLAGEQPDARRLDRALRTRLDHFLRSHAISINLQETGAAARRLGAALLEVTGLRTAAESGRKGGGGLGGGGKKGGLGMLGAMMLMSKATMGAIAMGGLALLAGKALIVGLLSLLLSAIVGIKALSSSKGGGGSVTYEIVQKPVYSHAHSHSHEEIHSGGHHGGGGGGYRRRSLDAADNDAHHMAYSSHAPRDGALDGAR